MILVIAFGSVLAMGLPVGVALSGIVVGSMIVLLSNLLTMPDFAPFLGVMIGLGVGIDYALFIVTRYRENLHHGHTPRRRPRSRSTPPVGPSPSPASPSSSPSSG